MEILSPAINLLGNDHFPQILCGGHATGQRQRKKSIQKKINFFIAVLLKYIKDYRI